MSRLILTTLAATASLLAYADWPHFRGADGSGAIPDAVLPTSLDPKRNIAWEIPLPGRGLSSPIIVGDRVFVTCSSGPKQARLHVLCFRASDGVKLWERQFFATGRTMCHEKTSVAANSPATDGQRVFALFSSNDLVALDLDGNLLWLRALTLDYPNVSNSLGMSSSLVVADGTVVAQVENDTQPLALGIDAATGVNRWRLERPKMANWTSPILYTDPSTGQKVVALQSGKGLLGIEPATGKELWNYAEGASTVPSSAAANGVLYVPSSGITAIKPTSPGQPPTQLWRANTLRPGTSSPAVFGDRVYTINGAGVLSCGDTKDGNRVWQLRLKGPFSASPVMAGRFLYVPNEAGLLQVVDTSKPEGELVSEMDLGQTILSTPAISGNALFLRSDGKLWKVSGGT
ncbi:MAG: PQQ-binding-like beta-propeller repeat protein [Verrucomicrobiales bacterium]|nr:PQQ-binding-like beta-propeller repeat protein [Verrucomicrobiales bacterium]